MTKRFGFTLAEVLITLGIIGVVAAMSIPTLIANTNSAKFRSQFKKTVATLNQAALMSTAQFDFDFAGVSDSSGITATDLDPKSKSSVAAMLAGTLSGATIGAIADISASYNNKLTDATHYVKLADGSLFAFNGSATGCTVPVGTPPGDYLAKIVGGTNNYSKCVGYIDVNGTALPNDTVKCADNSADTYSGSNDCTVPNDAAHMKDIFPVVFHDAVVEPSTNAARYVLTAAK